MNAPSLVSVLLAAANDVGYGVGVGRIKGGWEFVWAAYGITWLTFTLYGLSLWVRRPKQEAGPTAGKEQP